MTEIIALNRALGIALTDEDGLVHITDFIGPDGQPCAENEAVAAVGYEPWPEGEGEGQNGRWWSIDLTAFEERPEQ